MNKFRLEKNTFKIHLLLPLIQLKGTVFLNEVKDPLIIIHNSDQLNKELRLYAQYLLQSGLQDNSEFSNFQITLYLFSISDVVITKSIYCALW